MKRKVGRFTLRHSLLLTVLLAMASIIFIAVIPFRYLLAGKINLCVQIF